MDKEQIPAFVSAVLRTGADINAVGIGRYVIDDAHRSVWKRWLVQRSMRGINNQFGERDHLQVEIAGYLRSIGRFLS